MQSLPTSDNLLNILSLISGFYKDGTYRWIHNKAASLKNNDGKVIRLFGTHTDITESKLSEAIFKRHC